MSLTNLEVTELEQGKAIFREDIPRVSRSLYQQSLLRDLTTP